MYRVRHVDRHGYRKTPSGNAPSVGLITPRVGIRRGAGCQRLKVCRCERCAGGNASPTSAGAHGRPDGSQWRVVLGTRRSVQGRGRQSRCPSPDNRHARGRIAAQRRKTLWGGAGERGHRGRLEPQPVERTTRGRTRVRIPCAVPYYFAPGRAPGRAHGRVTRTYYAGRGHKTSRRRTPACPPVAPSSCLHRARRSRPICASTAC